MSTMQWLESLAFHGRGDVYRRWLGELRAPPRIAWYPAAGEDLRDLLYLSHAYAQRQPGNLGAAVIDPAPPFCTPTTFLGATARSCAAFARAACCATTAGPRCV
jgi:hypothetical protein